MPSEVLQSIELVKMHKRLIYAGRGPFNLGASNFGIYQEARSRW